MARPASAIYGPHKVAMAKEMARTLIKVLPRREVRSAIQHELGVSVSSVTIWQWAQRRKTIKSESQEVSTDAGPDFPDLETDEIDLQDGMKESFAFAVKAVLWAELNAECAKTIDERADAIGRGLVGARTVGDLFSKMIEKMDDGAKSEALDKMQVVLNELRVRKNAVAS